MKKIKKFGKVFFEFDVFEMIILYITEIVLGFTTFFVLLWISESIIVSIFSLFFVWMGIIHIENIVFNLKEGYEKMIKKYKVKR